MDKLLKLLAILWLFLLIGLVVFTTTALRSPHQLQFDLLSLLPDSHQEETQEITKVLNESGLSNQFVVLVGHEEADKAQKAYIQLRQGLLDSGLPLKEDTIAPAAYTNFFSLLYPHRAGFLAESDRFALLNFKEEELAERALININSPFSSKPDLKGDPFLLFPQYVKSLHPSLSLQVDDQGFPYTNHDGKHWYIFKGIVEASAFSLELQKAVNETLKPLQDSFPTRIETLKTGALFYAAAGAKQAQTEISFIGGLSLVLIIALLLLVFRSLRPLIFSAITIGAGFIGGLTATLLIFSSVHILSLIFGLSLMGIAVDYAIHYYCAGSTSLWTHKDDILKKLFPALPLGVISSAFGYGVLYVLPFPGIQQMAVLTSAGLIFSFITVCLWGKYFISTPQQEKESPASQAQQLLEKALSSFIPQRTGYMLSATLLILFLGGMLTYTTEDNVRAFQSLDITLQQQESQIKNILHLPTSSSFFIIKGDSPEDRLQTEETLIEHLTLLKGKGEIKGMTALSTLIPSLQKQSENKKLIQDFYTNQIPFLYEALGMTRDLNRQELGLDTSLLPLSDIQNKGFPPPWHNLYTPQYHRIFITGITNPTALYALADSFENVHYVDPPQVYSHIFKEYRQMLSLSVCAVILVIAFFLSLKFSPKGAITLLSPVILSVLGGLGILSLAGFSLTVFTAMGFLLVVCIGVDYALFLYCRKSSSVGPSLLANAMAAFTTLVSFGLLSLSQTMAVHSFGIAVFVGITLCFMMTTFLIGIRDGR